MNGLSLGDGLRTFSRGGVHLADDRKSLTADRPIESFIPAEVTIPLAQHLGPPATATVQRKARVTRGDLIGAAGPDGVAVHASVSGTVLRVATQPHPTLVEAPAVVIATDPSAIAPVWEEAPGWSVVPREQMLEHIAAAGVVGLGGAAFPTHRKLRLPAGVTIDTLILNGAECEPYLTSDQRLMVEQPQAVLWGAACLARLLDASCVLIGVEANAPQASTALSVARRHWFGDCVPDVAVCRARYPQGSERQLVQALTGRVVPAGTLPMAVGVMVQNVATAVACYHAIRYRMPLLDRIITVTGSGIVEPKNLCVPIGTLVSDIVAACGGMHPRIAKVVAGGPMMGRALGRLDCPIIKGMAGLLFLCAAEARASCYGPCIACGRCLAACPLGLEPNQIGIYTEAGRALETEPFGTRDCYECGCCAYVCPAERPLVQFIQLAKGAFRSGSQIGLGGDRG